MLMQGIIKIDGELAFIDVFSDLCISDGKPCDYNGDIIYTTDKGIYKESDFKQYRKYSPEFRRESIKYFFESNLINLTGESCSCSRCSVSSEYKEFYRALRSD